MSDPVSRYLTYSTASLVELRSVLLGNIAWHERAIAAGLNRDWHKAELARRRTTLMALDAELARRAQPDQSDPKLPPSTSVLAIVALSLAAWLPVIMLGRLLAVPL